MVRDIYNHKQRYKNQLIEISTFSPIKKKAFLNFNRYMITRDLSLARKITLLSNLKAFIDTGMLKSNTRNTIYSTVSKIEAMKRSPNTRRDYKLAYKSYLHSIGTKKELVDLIIVGNPAIRIPKKILDRPLYPYMETEDEQLFVRLAQETGARPGELMNLQYKDIKYTDFGADITLTGKTGSRTIPIIDSAQMLLESHRKARNNEDFVFWFTYDHISKKVADMLKKQGYEETHLYAFRKSRASIFGEDARISEQLIKKYLGWSKNSRMLGVYVFPRQEKLTDTIIRINTDKKIPKKQQTSLSNWGA